MHWHILKEIPVLLCFINISVLMPKFKKVSYLKKFRNTIVLSHKDLQTYCDFAEVVDISIRQGKEGTNMNRIVSINRQDGKILVSLL